MWSSGRLTVHLCIKLMLTAKFNTVFISASSIKTNLNDFDFGYIIIFQMSHTNHEYHCLRQVVVSKIQLLWGWHVQMDNCHLEAAIFRQ